MTLIIEGVDGAGKTTLINKLKEHYGIDSLGLSYRDPTDYQFYSRLLEKSDCIFDRHFLSEIIYSKIFKRMCSLDSDEVIDLLCKCKDNNIKILILDTDTETIEKRLLERKTEEKEILKDFSYIRLLYLKMAQAFSIEVIDTSKINFKDIIRKVENK